MSVSFPTETHPDRRCRPKFNFTRHDRRPGHWRSGNFPGQSRRQERCLDGRESHSPLCPRKEQGGESRVSTRERSFEVKDWVLLG